MNIENNQKLYFNIFFFIPYLLWSILILIYVFNSDLIKAGEINGLIKLGNDSSRYIFEAEKLANFNFTNLYISKLSYIILLAIALYTYSFAFFTDSFTPFPKDKLAAIALERVHPVP